MESKQKLERNGGAAVRVQRMVRILAELQSREDLMKFMRHATHLCVGEKMYQVRKSAGLSLRETARRLKCSAPFLSDMENGRRAQSIEWVRKLETVTKHPNAELKNAGPRTPDVRES